MRRKSNMLHSFAQSPRADIQRSSFNRSNNYKTTFDAGDLIPVYCDEVYPGDTIKMKPNVFARLATPITPYMDNLFLDMHWFFVPCRLVWDNWEKFNGAQDNPGDSTTYVMPKTTTTAVTGELYGSLSDYFGIPTEVPGLSLTSLPFRAYQLIWNEWYRDENLQNSITVSTGNGPDAIASYQLPAKRGKRHDYFTSALPWPQKGPSVSIPLASATPVEVLGKNVNTMVYGTNTATKAALRRANAGPDITNNQNGSGADDYLRFSTVTGEVGLQVDLSTAMGTINALRQAVQIQKMYERDARGGTRYTEVVLAHFNVVSPDARLQRPEFLGGGSTPLNVNPVAQTSSTDATTPQGNVASFGTANFSGAGFTRSFTEHGYVIGLVSARADLNYQQGLDRIWSRDTRFDWYWPSFAHLGEQSILNKEIYAQGTADPTADAAVFGYAERYAELRFKNSQITGLFRSNHPNSLDYWHLAQDFTALPTLNSAFIVENPPIDRIIATPTEPQFLFDAFFESNWARPMPTYSVPGQMDRF